MKNHSFATIEEAIEHFRQGKIIIAVDDENRENEGDFIMAAETATPEAVNFMITHGRGLLCVPASAEIIEKFELDMMTQENQSLMGTPFTVSVDAVEGTTTGISAFERAKTIRTFVDPNAGPKDFARPGHIFPLRAQKGGVLKRAGHTETVVDLAKLAGLKPVGVLCEILNEDGTMARLPELQQIAQNLDMPLITVQDLIEYRRRTEKLVLRSAEATLPTEYGEFKIIGYETSIDNEFHVALVKGDICADTPTLVRVHSQCLTGDVFHSLRCDCGEQLDYAMKKIAENGNGVLLYMHQEGRGIGLINKLKAYQLQEKGFDTVDANLELGFEADLREYGIGAQILQDLGVKKIRLLTNNPKKMIGLQGFDLEIVERLPIKIEPNKSNIHYLNTKKEKLGHLL